MLTQNDLSQIALLVRQIIREEVPPMIRKELKIETKPIWRELKQLRLDINETIKAFDRDFSNLRNRLDDHLENHKSN